MSHFPTLLSDASLLLYPSNKQPGKQQGERKRVVLQCTPGNHLYISTRRDPTVNIIITLLPLSRWPSMRLFLSDCIQATVDNGIPAARAQRRILDEDVVDHLSLCSVCCSAVKWVLSDCHWLMSNEDPLGGGASILGEERRRDGGGEAAWSLSIAIYFVFFLYRAACWWVFLLLIRLLCSWTFL